VIGERKCSRDLPALVRHPRVLHLLGGRGTPAVAIENVNVGCDMIEAALKKSINSTMCVTPY